MRIAVLHARLMRGLQRYCRLHAFRVLSRPLMPLEAASGGGLRFALLGEAELAPYCGDPALELPAASASRSFARGDLCAAAFDGEQLVGYAWFAFGATPESDGVWVQVASGACYTYRHFVRPSHRGRGIARALLRAADAATEARARNRCVTLIHTHNRASVRASERAGSRGAGYAAHLTVFGRLLCWYSPGARALGLRFFRPQSNLSRFSFAMRRFASMLAATTSRN